MTDKYFKRNIKVSGHIRYDPRIKKKVNVSGYSRNQRYRNYRKISRTRAQQLFDQQPLRAKSMDIKSTAKITFENPNEYWVEHMNRSDVKGIDTKKDLSKPETEGKEHIKTQRIRKHLPKDIDITQTHTKLNTLVREFNVLNELIYSPEKLSEKDLMKFAARREELLAQRKKLKSEHMPQGGGLYKYDDFSKGISIRERKDPTYGKQMYVEFDYNTYSKLSNREKEMWRACARWNPINKEWRVYKPKNDDAFSLLAGQGLIPKDHLPQTPPSLRDIYLSHKPSSKEIVIEIDDEKKNATIDADPSMLRKIDAYYSFYMKGYEHSDKYKSGKWDGKIHIIPSSHKELPKNLAYHLLENKKEIDPSLDISIMDFRKHASRASQFDLKNIKLYDYQKKAIKKAISQKQGLIVAATGSGKTEIAAGIIAEYGEDNDSVFLVHTTALQDQAEKRLESRLGKDVGTGGGSRHEIVDSKKGDVNVIMLQSLYSALENKKEGKPLTDKQKELIKTYKDAEVVIQDEAHHVKADTFEKVITHAPTKHLYGLSATPYRDENDEKLVFSQFGRKVADVSVDSLIHKKRLVQPEINIIEIPPSQELSKIRLPPGARKYNAIRKAQITNNESRNEVIAKLANDQEKKGRTTLIFVDRIEHGKNLAKKLNKPFLNGQNLTEKTRERHQKVLEDVVSGKEQTIVATQQLFGEGFDLPAIDSLIIADAGGQSRVRTMQRAGRVLRTKKGKEKAEIFEFNDKADYLNDHFKERIKTYREHETFVIKT